MNGLAPQFISALLTDYNPVRHLRTSGRGLLPVPRPSVGGGLQLGDPAFWNKLPARSITFKNKVETFLFSQAVCVAWLGVCFIDSVSAFYSCSYCILIFILFMPIFLYVFFQCKALRVYM